MLISEYAQNAACLHYFVGLARAVALGQQSLTHRLAIAVDQPVEVRIVKRAGNGISPKAPKIADVAKRFEIAEMPRHADLRPALAGHQNPLAFLGDLNVFSPVRLVK